MASISVLKETRDSNCRLTVFLNLLFAPQNGKVEKNPNALFGGYDIGSIRAMAFFACFKQGLRDQGLSGPSWFI